MGKIRLDIDELTVDTFSVLPERVGGDGTVQGHGFENQVGYDSVNNPSCFGSCGTCPGGVTCTCPATCVQTCNRTCPPCAIVVSAEAPCRVSFDIPCEASIQIPCWVDEGEVIIDG